MIPVAFDIPLKFWKPVIAVRLRRAGDFAVFIRVLVPKAAVDKNHFSASRENQVRLSWQILAVKAVPVAHPMSKAPNRHFRAHSFTFYSSHVIASLL